MALSSELDYSIAEPEQDCFATGLEADSVKMQRAVFKPEAEVNLDLAATFTPLQVASPRLMLEHLPRFTSEELTGLMVISQRPRRQQQSLYCYSVSLGTNHLRS